MLHCNKATHCNRIRSKGGEIMDSALEHHGKPARRPSSIGVGSETARHEKNGTETGEPAFLSAPAPKAAESEFGLTGPSRISARTRLAYGLLKAAIEDR